VCGRGHLLLLRANAMDLGQSARCPHCHKPLRVVEEVFRDWTVFEDGQGGWVLGPPEPFEAGFCAECGEFVDATGKEDLPPERS
jgi:hypothetical protein